jgi:hypothetical protein
MSDDYIFIDCHNDRYEDMVNGWIDFFKNYPTYKNYITKVESHNNLVILIEYAI